MEASDAQIPVIYQKYANISSAELKSQYLEFLKKYKNDVNDYGGKIVKILELLNSKGKSSFPLLKALVSKKSRPLLMKITSFWVTEHLAKTLTPQIIFQVQK